MGDVMGDVPAFVASWWKGARRVAFVARMSVVNDSLGNFSLD